MYQLRPLLHESMTCMCVCGSELPPLLAQVPFPAEQRCNVCGKLDIPLKKATVMASNCQKVINRHYAHSCQGKREHCSCRFEEAL